MINKKDGLVTIKCDKCGKEATGSESTYNDVFWAYNWVLNRGRKYEHLCFDCAPSKRKKQIEGIKKRLNG